MSRNLVWTLGVLALAGTLTVAQPAAAQSGPQPGYRPPVPRTTPYEPAPYGRGRGYNDPAYERGVADGYDEGFDDARDRDRYDPRRNRRYRSGDSGYRGWYGPREYYRNNYRQGFLAGYERGYRDAARHVRRDQHGSRGGGWIGFGWRY
jgi:hypothetical protein